jgi:hypothetical protein
MRVASFTTPTGRVRPTRASCSAWIRTTIACTTLVLDTTTLPIDEAVERIVRAAEERMAATQPASSS